MTLDEARMVLFVLDDVDGGCPECVERAAVGLRKRLPFPSTDFSWLKAVDAAEELCRADTAPKPKYRLDHAKIFREVFSLSDEQLAAKWGPK